MVKKYANVSNADRPVSSIASPRTLYTKHRKLNTEFDAGWVVPIYIAKTIPSETTKLKFYSFGRLATPVVAFFDNLRLSTFFFYFPLRILWDNFVKMMGQRENPNDPIDFAMPSIIIDPNTADPSTLKLFNYLGIPIPNLRISAIGEPPVYNTLEVCSLPFRAVNFVYNTFFRDKNLQDSKVLHLDDGATETQDDYVMFRRGKPFDYFTSGAESPQRGDPVIVPLSGVYPIDVDLSLPVSGIGFGKYWTNETSLPFRETGKSAPTTDVVTQEDYFNYSGDGGTKFHIKVGSGTGDTAYPDINANLNVHSVVSNLGLGIAISDLRDGFAVTQILEMDLIGGSDYPDSMSVLYGMTIPYSDLKRPEYIGGGTTSVNIHPVPQTSSSQYGGATGSPQGNIGAFGTAVTGDKSGHSFYKTFYEHGYVIGFACLTADLSYQQGLDRLWKDSVRLDLHHPALNNTAEQPVFMYEIYCTGDPANDNKIFMFKESQYARDKENFSIVTGRMRSNSIDADGNLNSLDVYHLAEFFDNAPEFTGEFIESHPPMSRIKALVDEPDFSIDGQFVIDSALPLPAMSKPPNLAGTRL